MGPRGLVILIALALDLLAGDPSNRLHPVVLMGRWLNWGRRLAPARSRFWFGLGWTLAGITLFAGPWWVVMRRVACNKGAKLSPSWDNDVKLRLLSSRARFRARSLPPSIPPARGEALIPPPSRGRLGGGRDLADPRSSTGKEPLLKLIGRSLVAALLLKPVFAYRNLRGAVSEVAAALGRNDLAEARRLASWHLVSRDTSQLGEAEVVGAAIESLAENVTDSVTAPLLAFAAGGLPAAWGYRLVNTADAMWGYRSPEFEWLGKFPARLDDFLNWLPARLTGWLIVLAARLTGADGDRAGQTMLAQHSRVTSPNAGWTMSAMAGALNVTLSKRGVYELVGSPAEPTVSDIERALRISDVAVGLGVSGLMVAGLLYKKVVRTC